MSQGTSKDSEYSERSFTRSHILPANYSTGDITSDDHVRSVELGMSEQVSVGFISNKMIRNLCQNDIRSTKCPHYPGSRYNVGTEEEPEFEICTFSVDEARNTATSIPMAPRRTPMIMIIRVSTGRTNTTMRGMRKRLMAMHTDIQVVTHSERQVD